jgi:hypothetical protein
METINTKHSSSLVRGALGLALICGSLTLLTVIARPTPVAIDRQKWVGDAAYRQSVAQEVAKSGQLLGLDEEAVRRELGSPDRRSAASDLVNAGPDTSYVWRYALKFPGEAVDDTLNLVLVFGKTGRVNEVYVQRKD